jgi:choline-glycine betaine transporter
MKRIVGLIVLALVVFWVISSPDSAANVVQSIGAGLRNAADAVVRFFAELV